MKSGVYQIRNIINGKRYVGSTSDLASRRRHHFGRLRRGVHSNTYLQNAFNKYGEKAFIFEILELVEIDKLLISEQKLLDTNPEYNLVKIAGPMFRLGMKNSPEHCAKMSEAAKRQPKRTGWHHSEDSIEKMRLKSIGRKPRVQSLEEKNKRSETKKRYWEELSDEKRNAIREKISSSQRTPDRQGSCIICNILFKYRPNGKNGIKTCGKECLSKLKASNLARRNLENPDVNRKASLKRWSNYTAEQRKAFGETIGNINRKPKIETDCEICNKHFSYSSRGKQKLRTCSPECLSELRRINLKKRTDSNPDANREASLKRWNPTYSSSSDI